MQINKGFRTWIEVDKKAVARNCRAFRNLIAPGVKLMAVVKSNAYGHGLVDFSREVSRNGVDWLGVDSITEAFRLREEGFSLPILVLGYTLPVHFREAAVRKISLSISSYEQFSTLAKSRHSCAIHLKIDTGMHRQGFFNDELSRVTSLLKKNTQLELEGIFTHLAGKDPHNLKENRSQIELFEEAVRLVREAGFDPMRHACATWGTLAFPEAHFDMVRIGIGLYGMWPSGDIRRAFKDSPKLSPALTWKTVVSEIKELPRSGGVGYEFTEYIPEGSRIGICPIGYWHGYPRALSSVGTVLTGGKRAKVIGRVSMDMIVIDLTEHKNTRTGDDVVLMGLSGDESISAEEFASRVPGSSHYEVITRINPLIERIYR